MECTRKQAVFQGSSVVALPGAFASIQDIYNDKFYRDSYPVRPVATSHNLIALSSPPEAKVLPSGLKATA